MGIIIDAPSHLLKCFKYIKHSTSSPLELEMTAQDPSSLLHHRREPNVPDIERHPNWNAPGKKGHLKLNHPNDI